MSFLIILEDLITEWNPKVPE